MARPNACVDPTHRRSENGGRCLDCLKVRRKAWRKRASRKLGAPRRAETFEGKPCRKCSATERYVRGKTCVACSRIHGKERTAGSVIIRYHVPAEFVRWVTAPALEINV